MGRCKSCNETYKVIIVYVKTGRKPKVAALASETRPEAQQESKAESSPDTSLPAWQLPSDSSLFGSTNEPYSGLSEALFGKDPSDQSKESGSSNSQ